MHRHSGALLAEQRDYSKPNIGGEGNRSTPDRPRDSFALGVTVGRRGDFTALKHNGGTSTA